MSTLQGELARLERLIAAGQAAEALAGYRRLLARRPHDPVLRNRVSLLEGAARRDAPEWQVITYVITPRAVAEAHVLGGRYDAALEILQALLEKEPRDTGLARRVAMVRALRDGATDPGIETTASTRFLTPEMLVDAHIAAADFESALKILRTLVERLPGNKKLQARLAALEAAYLDDPASTSAVERRTIAPPAAVEPAPEAWADAPTTEPNHAPPAVPQPAQAPPRPTPRPPPLPKRRQRRPEPTEASEVFARMVAEGEAVPTPSPDASLLRSGRAELTDSLLLSDAQTPGDPPAGDPRAQVGLTDAGDAPIYDVFTGLEEDFEDEPTEGTDPSPLRRPVYRPARGGAALQRTADDTYDDEEPTLVEKDD